MENRISSLPEAVLIHILLFLPTIDAVRTSVLARNWRNLWLSLGVLDFNLDDILHKLTAHKNGTKKRKRTTRDENRVMNVVDKVLMSHNRLDIHRFSLSYEELGASSSASWIRAVVSRKLQHINLTFTPDTETSQLPSCLFKAEFLLVLEPNLRRSELKLSASIALPSLRSVRLSGTTFSGDNAVRELFSGCRVLKDLTLQDCRQTSIKNFEISSPSLKILKIVIGLEAWKDDSLRACTIIIMKPKLASLIYKGYLAKDYKIGNLPSLVNATIDILGWSCDESNMEHRGGKLFTELNRARYLKVEGPSISVLANFLRSTSIATAFSQLKHLELSMTFGDASVQSLISLLEDSFYLRTLKICSLEGNDQKVYKLQSGCKMRNLREFEIDWFGGTKDELEFLKFCLAHETLLERMTVTSWYYLTAVNRKRIIEELCQAPRACASLVLAVL